MSPINAIIERCGGSVLVRQRLGKTRQTIDYVWPIAGIPDRHWAELMALAQEQGCKLSPAELYRANCAARQNGPHP